MFCLIRQLTVLFMIIFLSPFFSGTNAQPGDVIEVGKFSAGQVANGLPNGWKPLTFKKIERHTVYSLVKDGDTEVVKAVAESSASGLAREIKINPKEYPIVE